MPDPSKEPTTPPDNWRLKARAIYLCALLLPVAAGTGIYLISTGDHSAAASSALMIDGVVIMILTITLMSMIFTVFGKSGKSQALGLPKGSIRALLALGLVVLFCGMSMFLYSSLSAPEAAVAASGLYTAEKDVMVKGLAPGTFYASVEPGSIATADKEAATAKTAAANRRAKAATAAIAALDAATKNPSLSKANETAQAELTAATAAENAAGNRADYFKWTVRVLAQNPGTQDMAKQIVTLLGTLLTSIAGFYFGSATSNSASSLATTSALSMMSSFGAATIPPAAPQILKIDPLVSVANSPYTCTVTGTNLARVSVAQLQQPGSDSIPGIVSNVSDGSITCTFKVPATAKGSWTIVLGTSAMPLAPVSVTIQ